MLTEIASVKSKVAQPKRRWFGGCLAIICVVLVLLSIWMQSDDSSPHAPKKPVVTASQTDARVWIETQPDVEEIEDVSESVPEENLSEENKLKENYKDLKVANPDLLSQLQEKIYQQQIRLQQATAQKKLVAPSSVYQINNKSDAKESNNPLAHLFDANSQFANAVANQSVMSLTAQQQELTDYKIFQGKVIPAVLDTAVNSDLPGMLRATISEDVYGETGKQKLLPRGTRLIGHYNSAVSTGQVRVYVIWSRAITPQQIDIRLASPGIDSLGRGGLAGHVDNHFWDIFGTSSLLSVMAAGASSVEAPNSDTLYGNPYQIEMVESFTDSSDEILSRRLDIKPTITIDQGTPVSVMVAHDLNFSELSPKHDY